MEETNHIQLIWRGPYPLENFGSNMNAEDASVARNQGVYLHCLEKDSRYFVVYVGKADSIINRQKQHERDLKHHRSSLVDISAFMEHLAVDVFWIPDYGMKDPTIENIEKNLKSFVVFFAYVEEDPQLVEGALQIHFWRHAETRKHLLTQKISDWKYRGTIHNGGQFEHINELLEVIELQESSDCI